MDQQIKLPSNIALSYQLIIGSLCNLIFIGLYLTANHFQTERPVGGGFGWYFGHILFIYILGYWYIAIPHILGSAYSFFT
jgi:hypothetical protein